MTLNGSGSNAIFWFDPEDAKAPAVSYEDVVRTMKAISTHRTLVGI